MTDVEIHELTPKPTAAVRVTAPTSELADLFDTHLPAIGERVADLGAEPSGPPYARYHSFGEEQVDVEIGIPLTRPLPNVPALAEVPPGELGAGTLPGGHAAVTVHRGPYDGLPETYAALEAWIGEQGRSAGGAPWESYVDMPTEVDEADLRTEIVWPLT